MMMKSRSRAFDGYNPLEDASDQEALKLHTLDCPTAGEKRGHLGEDVRPQRVSHVAWSNAGSTVAACFEQVSPRDETTFWPKPPNPSLSIHLLFHF